MRAVPAVLVWLLALFISASAQAHVSAVPFPEIGSLQDATHEAAFFMPQTYLPPATPQITCNLVTGTASVGGPCTSGTTCVGSPTDDAPAFAAFKTWALANQGTSNQVVLTIPSGKTCFFGTGVAGSWPAGINNLIVEGNTSTITSIGGSGFSLGGVGICQKGLTDAAGCSARIQSVSAGSSTVTLTAASLSAGYVSRFTTGKWIMIGGLNTQALWNSPFGYPPNLNYFEWRQIINVNAGTGVITLDRALSNSYLSTWPLANSGSAFEADAGGPATIWTVGDSWNTTQEYRNLTISQDGQTNNNGRSIIYRNLIVGAGCSGSQCGPIPSQNESFAAYTANYTGLTMEVDKLIGTLTMDGLTISQLKFQSNSIDLFVGRNLTVTNNLTGGGKRSEISDSTLAAWTPGAYAYGNSTTNICTRCAVASFGSAGGIVQGNPSEYSMSGGEITFANTDMSGSDPAQRIFAPLPTNIFYTIASGGAGDTIGLFRPQSQTQDATFVHVQTNEAGTFPTYSGGIAGFRTHPSPQFTCDTCTGSFALTTTTVQAGATPLAPLGSYASAALAPTSAQGALGLFPVYGKINTLTINVTQAYSGAGAAVLQMGGQFNNQPTVKQSDWSSFTWAPQINLKQAGSRVITPSGVTCNGVAAPTGCSGDSLGTALPEAVWIRGGIQPYMGSTLGVGTQPLVTITIQTDQGVVP